MSKRLFDRDITDQIGHSAMRVSVTSHDNFDEVQINIQPADQCWPRITFFLGNEAARKVGEALRLAASATAAPVGWKTVDTDTD